ncbi:MAG: Ig-like domain-containing protein [Clostridia bacterium]|nr:Ig-like domain-containing protein [Clostridia bacterium]
MMNGKRIAAALVAALLLTALCVSSALAADLEFRDSKVTIFEGKRQYLHLSRSGAAKDAEVSWSSNNTRVATVNEKGMVTGISKGQATITASCRAGSRTVKATCLVTVQRAVTSLEIKENGWTVLPGDDMDLAHVLTLDLEGLEDEDKPPVLVLLVKKTVNINYSWEPRDASSNRITITSTNETVVSQNGRNNQLRVNGPGECLVTIASESNPEVAKIYHVLAIDQKETIRSIKATVDRQTIGVGNTVQIETTISPDNAFLPYVSYSSSDENVCTVDEYGEVTGVGRGNATIRVTAKDGSGQSRTVNIQVQQQPTEIQLDNELVVAVGKGGKQINATVLPANANNKKLTYASSDPSIAKVNNSGYVTPVSAGTCYVTVASAIDPTVFSDILIVVNQPVTRITFDQNVITVNVNEQTFANWNTLPYDATDPSVSLSSSNERIFTVTQSGRITGVKRGEAYLNVKATDGGNCSARIKVQVLQPVEGVHMYQEVYYADIGDDTFLNAVLEPSDASNTRMSWYVDNPSVARISGNYTRATLVGLNWGETTVTGITEDGGYMCTCLVKVGNYNNALKITDLYTQDNVIKIGVYNDSVLQIERFNFNIEVYDIHDKPIVVTTGGANVINGYYPLTLYQYQSTQHGRFVFKDFVQPYETIGRMVMRITGYTTVDGMRKTIDDVNKQPVFQFMSPLFVGPEEETIPEFDLEPLIKEQTDKWVTFR